MKAISAGALASVTLATAQTRAEFGAFLWD
jgi:hypothetical protein